MGKLLLKADGILLESFCPLDPPPPYLPPERWDAPHVAHRFAEAIGVVLRLPAGRLKPAGYQTRWVPWVREWDKVMGTATNVLDMVGDGAISQEFAAAHRQWHRDRNRVRRDPPTAIEISQMEWSIVWPGRYLRRHADQARALNLVAMARARDLELADIVQNGKHAGVRSPAVWQELALAAASEVAYGLRRDGVTVF